MKTKKLFVATAVLIAVVFGFTACIYGSKGNSATYPSCAVVVYYNVDMGGTIIGTPTPYGYCAAPELSGTYNPGDGLILNSFMIDGDNQPSTQYITASNISVSEVVPPFQFRSGQYDLTDLGVYTLPISNILSLSSNPCYGGKVFFTLVSKDNGPNYLLTYNTAEPDSAGIKNLYLQAQPLSASTTDVQKNYLCDLSSLIYQFGIDTTVSSVNYKYIKINLKYYTGMSDTNTPKYKPANDPNSPLYISVFKDGL